MHQLPLQATVDLRNRFQPCIMAIFPPTEAPFPQKPFVVENFALPRTFQSFPIESQKRSN